MYIYYIYIYIYIYIYTVEDKKKFRIPFRRTAVVRLKNGGGNGTPIVKTPYSKLSRGELLVQPLHSIDVFSMLGPPRA